MAKSADQIAKAIGDEILAVDPIIDITKGPYYDTVIRPPSTELATAAANVERVGTLYSRMVDTTNDLSAAEIDALGRAFKVTHPVGTRAKVLLVFYTTSKPVTEIVIPAGTPASTTDGQLIFVTTQTLRGIDASNASSYFDANSGRYLFSVQAVAVGEGDGYNLPAYRINRVLRNGLNVTGVYNPVPSSGGIAPLTTQSYLEQIQKAFEGRDTGKFSGLATELVRRGITQPLMFVEPSETDAFFRPVVGAAADIYMADAEDAAEDEIVASNGRTEIVLLKQPVIGVESVSVNSVLLDTSAWSLKVDRSPSYVGSSQSKTAIVLASSGLNDLVRIRYSYSGSVQRCAESLDENDVLGADLMPRLLQPLAINISAEVTCPIDLISDVKSAIQYYVMQAFVQVVRPRETFDYIRKTFPEVKNLRWAKFDIAGSDSVRDINVRSGLRPYFKTGADLQVTAARR